MAGATVEIQGQSDVGAVVSTDLAKAKAALADVEKGGQGASKAAEGTSGSFGGLAVAAAGAGAALVALKAATDVAIDLVKLGAETKRATFALDELTNGQSPAWMREMSAATHGVIDDEAGATIAAKLLASGLINTSGEAAHLAQVATVLGASFANMKPEQATEAIANMLNTMSSRPLKEFGINIEQLTGRTKALKETNASLSDQQAFSMAFFEQADPLAAKLSGVLDDQQASVDKLAVSWGNLTEVAGEFSADLLIPAIEAVTSEINTALRPNIMDTTANMDDLKRSAASTSTSFVDWMNTLDESGVSMQAGRGAVVQLREEYEALMASQVAGAKAAGDDAKAIEVNQAAVEGMITATAGLTTRIDIYNAAMQIQAGLQLNAEQQVSKLNGLWWEAGTATKGSADTISGLTKDLDGATLALTKMNLGLSDNKKVSELQQFNLDLTKQKVNDLSASLEDATTKVNFGAGADMAGIFEFAVGQMDQMGLSATQLGQKYNDLGLLTGQVTQKQIEQGTGLRELDNLYAASKITVEEYIGGLSLIPGANTAADISTATLVQHYTDVGTALGLTSGKLDEYIGWQVLAAQTTKEGTKETFASLKKSVDDYNTALAGMSQPDLIEFQQTGGEELAALELAITGGLLTISGTPEPMVHIDGVEQVLAARDAVDKAVKSISGLQDKRVVIKIDYVQTVTGSPPEGQPSLAPEQIRKEAMGGPVSEGQGYLVGERGPEFFMPGVSGTIIPNHQLSSRAPTTVGGGAGGSSSVFYITIQGVNNAREMFDEVEREAATRGFRFAGAN